jgi:hypothetical protein
MDRSNQQSAAVGFTAIDTEFDEHLANMKPYILQLNDKKGLIRIFRVLQTIGIRYAFTCGFS